MLVELADEGPEVTPLRVWAHVEAGDQVLYHGTMTDEPWWPTIEWPVRQALRDQES
jgi:hypothetical protein